jgi:8-oxo-dGTP pyrophosphatase MutT (NUDIX family)
MKSATGPLLVVSALIEKVTDGDVQILLQTRWKPDRDPDHSGMLELPAGQVEPGELLSEALIREVYEETHLRVVIHLGLPSNTHKTLNDAVTSIEPLLCDQQVSGGPGWVNLTFVCRSISSGEPQAQPDETRDPHWVSLDELYRLLRETPSRIFPLQFSSIRAYLLAKGYRL